MKYNLRKDLLTSDNTMLSHLFLDCMASDNDFLNKMGKDFKSKSEEEREKVEVEIELIINGVSVNPKNFLDHLDTHIDTYLKSFDKMIAKKATQLVEKKLSSKAWELMDKLNDFVEILDSWEKDINWDIENPLVSKE
jgi:hypothetical protein